MSIDKHEWSDSDLALHESTDTEISLNMDFSGCRGYFHISDKDAVAIAKHFNEDRESLVEGIKELIATTRNKDAEVFSANDLQKLITKEGLDNSQE